MREDGFETKVGRLTHERLQSLKEGEDFTMHCEDGNHDGQKGEKEI